MEKLNIISGLWVVFLVVWLIGWMRTKPTQERQPVGRRLLYATPVTVGAYLLFTDRVLWTWGQTRVLPRSGTLGVVAILLTAAGIGLAIWARFYLGQNWSSEVSIKVGH